MAPTGHDAVTNDTLHKRHAPQMATFKRNHHNRHIPQMTQPEHAQPHKRRGPRLRQIVHTPPA